MNEVVLRLKNRVNSKQLLKAYFRLLRKASVILGIT